MEISIKTIKGDIFKVPAVDADGTVAALKTKLAEMKPEFENCKLIYSGKILDNANTVKSYNIGEGEFLVAMVQKAKPAPKPAAAPEPAPAAPAAPATPAAPAAETPPA